MKNIARKAKQIATKLGVSLKKGKVSGFKVKVPFKIGHKRGARKRARGTTYKPGQGFKFLERGNV